MDLRALSAFFVYVSDAVHRMRYVVFVAALLFIVGFVFYTWAQDISTWAAHAWRSEDVGGRLRRECESIIREYEPGAGALRAEDLVRGCVLQRGLKSP